MRSYGIMQGRLTPSEGRGIQFFPFDNWDVEFELGAEIGINEIEWIFDYDNYNDNPLWSSKGVSNVRDVIDSTSVVVHSICFDYFMRRPFYKASTFEMNDVRDENIEFAHRIIDAMTEVGASLMEIPMVDDSSIKNDEERKRVIDYLQDVLYIAEAADILIGCETDMPVGVFKKFLDDINHPRIRANYDSGNSSGLGYDHEDEINSLGDYIANVHVKDRVLHGTTVELGTGSADFDKTFSALKSIGYEGSVILQAARDEDGNEAFTIASQLEFVQGYCRKYGLE